MKIKITLTFDNPNGKLTDEQLKEIAHKMGLLLLEEYRLPSNKNVSAEEMQERRIL